MTRDMIYVKWRDAHVNALEEMETKDIVHRPWIYESVGFFVKDTEAGVTMSMDHGEDAKWRTRNFIPAEMIEEKIRFKIPIPRKPKKPETEKGQEE